MSARIERAPARAARPPIAVPAFIAIALVLGGASNPISSWSFALQLISILFLAYGAAGLGRESGTRVQGAMLWAIFAWLGLALAHLVPLPAAAWQALPGRAPVVEGLSLAGLASSWLPLSLDPRGTVHAALAAIPAAGLLALILRGDAIPAAAVARTVIAVALVSLLLAILQVQGSADSPLYIHAITNRDLGVGFFANANHLGTLLLISVPLVAALAAARPGRARLPAIGATLAAAAAAGAGIFLTASVAGILLLIPTTAASLLLPLRLDRRLIGAGLLAIVAAGLATVAAWLAGALPFLSTSLGSSGVDRLQIVRTTLEGIWRFWPAGSGLGSFPAVYPMLEAPASVTAIFVNHAHNDYLELLFETGMAGALLLGCFLYWWLGRCLRAWAAGDGESGPWAKAASIVTGIMLAHSLVDYPLRTPALMLAFLFFCLVLGHLTARPGGEARAA